MTELSIIEYNELNITFHDVKEPALSKEESVDNCLNEQQWAIMSIKSIKGRNE